MALRVNNDDDERRRSPYAGLRVSTKSPGIRFVPGASSEWAPKSDWYQNQVGRDGAENTRYAPTADNNWLTDRKRDFLNWWGEASLFTNMNGIPKPVKGGGLGDYLVGSNPNDTFTALTRRGGPATGLKGGVPGQAPDTSLPSFLSNLLEALGYVGDGSTMGYVSYDPLRNDAQQRGTEYDARLNAMYNQLQNSIRDDGTAIQGTYDTAIDSTADRATQAQADIQAASDAAADRNLQQLQALGIGEAAGNIVAEGRDLASQTANQVANAASRGQITGDALAQNQQSAVQNNTSLAGAAGLEGNLQRARVQSELGSLLAQYDMAEQQANQQVDQFNAQQRNQGLGQAMSLAQALTGNQWDQLNYQDELNKFLYEQQAAANQPNRLNESLNFLMQLQNSPQFADTSIQDLLPYIQALGTISKSM